MKKLFFILCTIIPIWGHMSAEENLYDVFKTDIESVFEYINKNDVLTGLLVEYGFHLISPELYNGVVTDSNYVNKFIWESLYSGLYDSKINNKCQMAEPKEVHEKASKGMGIIYYKYNTFADDALERGLVTFENEKIRIVPGKPSPYAEKECFAVMPPEGTYYMNIEAGGTVVDRQVIVIRR